MELDRITGATMPDARPMAEPDRPIWAKESPAAGRREDATGLKCYAWNLSISGSLLRAKAMRSKGTRQQPAARRPQYTDLIQAIIFQRSSSVLMISPNGGIGPTTASEPFRR
jgi:hypothetical protein